MIAIIKFILQNIVKTDIAYLNLNLILSGPNEFETYLQGIIDLF